MLPAITKISFKKGMQKSKWLNDTCRLTFWSDLFTWVACVAQDEVSTLSFSHSVLSY